MAQSCSLTAPAGNYGNVDILSGGTSDTTAAFTINCTGTKNTNVRLCIELSYGTTLNNANAQRALANGSNFLVHEIYSDSARTQVWGAWGGYSGALAYGSGGIQRDLLLNASGSGSLPVTMYGRISANQQTDPPNLYTWASTSPGITFFYSTTTNCPYLDVSTHVANAGSGADIWTATILKNCLVSATNVDFGSAGILHAMIDMTGIITVRCTNSTPYTIGLSNGSGGGTGPTVRKMVNGGAFITYGLYQDVARSVPFGATAGTDTQAGTGSGLAQPVTVYGRVPVQVTPAPGTYADTITVTVTF